MCRQLSTNQNKRSVHVIYLRDTPINGIAHKYTRNKQKKTEELADKLGPRANLLSSPLSVFSLFFFCPTVLCECTTSAMLQVTMCCKFDV